ncbi:MAG: 1-deoxy-D-xylulose-5-phosphate synthase, partial [Opitutales bacterium]|nr:1-deoxy-D-xylulose-5-phosphate synthase [Opitutales bacterium]
LDKELLLKNADENKVILTLEDHVRMGGFGSAIAECLIDNNKNCKLEIIGWPDVYIPHGTDVATIRNQFGLGREQILAKVKSLL